jgi:hypothetical protein
LGICDRIRRDRLKSREKENGKSKEVGDTKEEPN